MIAYRCDGCGRDIRPADLRYEVSIDVRAAYDEVRVGLLELVQDHRKELLSLIDKLKDKSPEDIEESVYKKIKIDLCPSCQRAYIHDPLRFHPEQGTGPDEVNIDEFLRSLGYGKSKPDGRD